MGETPTLAEVIRTAVDAGLIQLNTVMPGIVVSYDRATGLADVRPGFKQRFKDSAETQDLPVIPGVPVIMPGTMKSRIRLPIAKDDPVTLVFAQRALDRWLSSGGQVDPEDSRLHALKDAIAIPGLYPTGQAPTDQGVDTSLVVANGTAFVELTATGLLKMGNAADELLAIIDGLMDMVTALSTTNAVVGAPCVLGVTSAAQILALKVRLALVKA